MIKITMHGDKWRMAIGQVDGEVWEFNTYSLLLDALKEILKIKQNYGRIKPNYRGGFL